MQSEILNILELNPDLWFSYNYFVNKLGVSKPAIYRSINRLIHSERIIWRKIFTNTNGWDRSKNEIKYKVIQNETKNSKNELFEQIQIEYVCKQIEYNNTSNCSIKEIFQENQEFQD